MKLNFGNRHPLTIVFYLYDDGQNKTNRKIYCRVWILRSKAELSLNFTCKVDEWDSEAQRCFPTTKEFKHINYKLSEVEAKFDPNPVR